MKKSDRDEHIALALSTHWCKYVPIVFVCLVLAGLGVLLLWVAFHMHPQSLVLKDMNFIAGAALLLFAYHRFFHVFLSEQLLDLLMTNKRIIYYNDSILKQEDEHEIFLDRIVDVSVQNDSMVQKLGKFGTLWMDTGDGHLHFSRSIPYVPDPDSVAKRMRSLLK